MFNNSHQTNNSMVWDVEKFIRQAFKVCNALNMQSIQRRLFYSIINPALEFDLTFEVIKTLNRKNAIGDEIIFKLKIYNKRKKKDFF